MQTRASELPVIELTDESFEKRKTGSYHFSVFTDEKTFSFSVLDVKANKYLALCSGLSFRETNERILQSGQPHSFSMAVSGKPFTLVPNALFDENKKTEFFKFNCETGKDETVLYDRLRLLNAKNIYTVSNTLFDEAGKIFPGVRFFHGSSCFIEGLLYLNKNNDGKKAFADFSDSTFILAVLDGKKLIYSNTFSFASPEDVAYYILFVYEQLNMSPEKVELVLSGSAEKDSNCFSLLYNYIRNVKFITLPDVFQYSYKFEEIQKHKYFSLFCQYLCG